MVAIERDHTRWSVSQIFPIAFKLFIPPKPPADEEMDGGTSGIVRVKSTPESTVVIVISFLRGTGERLGLSIAQLSDIVTMVVAVEEKEDGHDLPLTNDIDQP